MSSKSIKESYTNYLKELEENRDRLTNELRQQIYDSYPSFLSTFKDLQSVTNMSLSFYNNSITQIEQALNHLLKPIPLESSQKALKIEVGNAEWWQEIYDTIDNLLVDGKIEECIHKILEVRNMKFDSSHQKSLFDFDIQVLKVVESIGKEIQKPQSSKARDYIEFLKLIGAEIAAEDAYFMGKTQQLHGYLSSIDFADPMAGLKESTQVFFTYIRRTASEMNEVMGSTTRFFIWTKQEIKNFLWEINEHLYNFDSMVELSKSLKEILNCCKSLETDGIYLSNILVRYLIPIVCKRIQEIYAISEFKLEQEVSSESWRGRVVNFEGGGIFRFSKSCEAMIGILQTILKNASLIIDKRNPFWSSQIAPIFVKIASTIIRKYIESSSFYDREDLNSVLLCVGNLWGTSKILKPLSKQLATALQIPSAPLNEILDTRIPAKSNALQIYNKYLLSYFSLYHPKYFKNISELGQLRETSKITSLYNLEPLNMLSHSIEFLSSATDRDPEISYQICEVFCKVYYNKLEEKLSEVDTASSLTNLPPGAVQQLIADLYCLSISCESFGYRYSIIDLTEKLANEYSTARNMRVDLFLYHRSFYEELLASR
jgi:hypothetical protein